LLTVQIDLFKNFRNYHTYSFYTFLYTNPYFQPHSGTTNPFIHYTTQTASQWNTDKGQGHTGQTTNLG